MNVQTGHAQHKPAPAAPELQAAAPWSTGIAACDRYYETVERFMECPHIAESLRDSLRQLHLTFRQTRWTETPQVAEQCTRSLETFRLVAGSQGCTV